MASSPFYLLRLPCDIRRQIYESYYPVAKDIKLTSGPVSDQMNHADFTSCRLSSAAINLMRVCRKVNNEITVILYGTNTFSMVPSETLTSHPHLISPRWLHSLRSSTKRVVKKLVIHVELPMNRFYITGLISGVSTFRTLEIRVAQRCFTFKEGRITANFEELDREMTELCNGVMEGRGSARTTWNALGCFRTATYFYALHIIGTPDGVLQGIGAAYGWTVSGDEWTQRKLRFLWLGPQDPTSYIGSTLS